MHQFVGVGTRSICVKGVNTTLGMQRENNK